MSTLSGKPANPVDLSGYASRRAGEGVGGERHPIEDDRDTFRSPYAPKEAWRRAAAKVDPEVGSHDTTANAAPLAPARAPESLRAPEGLRGRPAVDADESRLCPDDAPNEELRSGWPSADEQAGRDHSPPTAFDADVADDRFGADSSADL